MDVVNIVMDAVRFCDPRISINTKHVILILVVDVLLFIPFQVYHYWRYW